MSDKYFKIQVAKVFTVYLFTLFCIFGNARCVQGWGETACKANWENNIQNTDIILFCGPFFSRHFQKDLRANEVPLLHLHQLIKNAY